MENRDYATIQQPYPYSVLKLIIGLLIAKGNVVEAQLFSPLQIRGVTLKNRIVVSPMLQYCADNGHVNDWHLMHYGKFAAGGTGLVFVESTKVDPRGCSTPRDLGLWKDDFIAPFKRITDLVRRNGAVPALQLGHSGRKARRSVPWEGRAPLASCPGVDHGEEWELIAPSAVAFNSKYAVPRAMTHDDIQEAISNWGQAARRANEAGFDVLEIHGAHGYLLHQFLSPVANQRSDEFGGTPEKRMRFPIEVVCAKCVSTGRNTNHCSCACRQWTKRAGALTTAVP